MAYYVVLPFGLIMSLVFCILRRKGFSLQNLILKSISSLCYLLTAVFALVSNPDAYVYGSLIIFGGALGLVGDILLDLKGLYKKDESTYLMGGFIFFLVGHLFYSGAIIYQTRMKWWIVLLCCLGGVVFSFANNFMAKFMKIHFGAYRKSVEDNYTQFLKVDKYAATLTAAGIGGGSAQEDLKNIIALINYIQQISRGVSSRLPTGSLPEWSNLVQMF